MIQPLENLSAVARQFLEGVLIQAHQKRPNRLIHIPEGKERLIT